MGSCISRQGGEHRENRKHFGKYGKRFRKISFSIHNMSVKRISDAGKRGKTVHPNFEKSGANSHNEGEVTNKSFQVTQMQWNHSQIDATGTFFLLVLLQKIFSISPETGKSEKKKCMSLLGFRLSKEGNLYGIC